MVTMKMSVILIMSTVVICNISCCICFYKRNFNKNTDILFVFLVRTQETKQRRYTNKCQTFTVTVSSYYKILK